MAPAESTTTLTVSPPFVGTLNAFSSQPQNNDDEVPLGAIVGGVAGGVCLAILGVLVWRIWHRSTKQRRTKEETACVTRRNTLRNKRTSAKLQSQSALLYTPPAAKNQVKWAASEKDRPIPDGDKVVEGTKTEVHAKPGLTASTMKSRDSNSEPSGPPSPTMPSRPKPLRSGKPAGQAVKEASRRPAHLAGDVNLPIPPPPTSPPLRAPRPKPSTVSSRSYYSLESGEEHPNSRPPRLHSVLSALGNLSEGRTSMPGNRVSVSSSMWSFFSRNSRVARTVGSSRYSQATSNSVYSQPDEPIVGVAY